MRGKVAVLCFHSLIDEDHPRTCGEKDTAMCFRVGDSGSPPHMRGKDWQKMFCFVEHRITPAHAGKR